MNEEILGKKIASYLDEIPIDEKMLSRLAYARKFALLKVKEKEFVEIENNTIMVLKGKKYFNNSWMSWMLIPGLFIASMFMQNVIRDKYFADKETVTLSSHSFEDFLGAAYQNNQDFAVWDNEMDKLLKD